MTVKTVNIDMSKIIIPLTRNGAKPNHRIHCRKCSYRRMHYFHRVPNLRIKYKGSEYSECFIAYCYVCASSRIVMYNSENSKTAIL